MGKVSRISRFGKSSPIKIFMPFIIRLALRTCSLSLKKAKWSTTEVSFRSSVYESCQKLYYHQSSVLLGFFFLWTCILLCINIVSTFPVCHQSSKDHTWWYYFVVIFLLSSQLILVSLWAPCFLLSAPRFFSLRDFISYLSRFFSRDAMPTFIEFTYSFTLSILVFISDCNFFNLSHPLK